MEFIRFVLVESGFFLSDQNRVEDSEDHEGINLVNPGKLGLPELRQVAFICRQAQGTDDLSHLIGLRCVGRVIE